MTVTIWLAQVTVSPTSAGMPGAQLLAQMLNWLAQIALWGSLASILAGAAVYGLAQHAGKAYGATRGRSLALVGDVGAMIRLVVREIPAGAVGTVLVGTVAAMLLKLTDAASSSVLGGTPADLEAFLQRLAVPGAAIGYGLLGGVVLAVFLLAGLFVWVNSWFARP